MRLIDPGPGEILDRLTILSLKIHYGRAAGKDVTHFEAERDALNAKEASGNWLPAALELGAINGALWRAEDDMRELRIRWEEASGLLTSFQMSPTDLRGIAQVAFRIQSLNDRRAECIAELNRLAGLKAGPEKL